MVHEWDGQLCKFTAIYLFINEHDILNRSWTLNIFRVFLLFRFISWKFSFFYSKDSKHNIAYEVKYLPEKRIRRNYYKLFSRFR